jgi:hypothetical protein
MAARPAAYLNSGETYTESSTRRCVDKLKDRPDQAVVAGDEGDQQTGIGDLSHFPVSALTLQPSPLRFQLSTSLARSLFPVPA